jgi:hypothetical protein
LSVSASDAATLGASASGSTLSGATSGAFAMSSSKKKDYSGLVKQARAAGLVNRTFERKDLTLSQKRTLTSIGKNYANVLKNPEKFFIKKVSQKTGERLKKTEHHVVNGHAVLMKRGYEHLKIKTTKAGVSLIKANGDRSERAHYYNSGADFLASLEKTKLKPGETLTCKFGNAGDPFPTRFDTVGELLKYLSKFGEKQLMALAIVKFNEDDEEI